MFSSSLSCELCGTSIDTLTSADEFVLAEPCLDLFVVFLLSSPDSAFSFLASSAKIAACLIASCSSNLLCSKYSLTASSDTSYTKLIL